MKPVGPLMIEHRLIERMIKVLDREVSGIAKGNKPNIALLETAIDFVRTYADRCHHGKEEAILFRDLAKKPLSPKHKKTMDELIQEHIYGRKTVGELVAAKEKYQQGDTKTLNRIVDLIKALVDFYPKHIAKEDKGFFIPCMDYFTPDEQAKMLNEFWEFDRLLIHEQYKKVVEQSEGLK